MERLRLQLQEIGSYIEQKDIKNTNVSNASVGWHLAHLLKIHQEVYKAMKSSNPTNFKKKFSLARIMIFFTGKIPRGKAKAPKASLPEANFTFRDLELQLHQAKQDLFGFENLPKNAHFPHPYFNQLNTKQTIKFLGIHNEHHLKIVREILKEQPD